MMRSLFAGIFLFIVVAIVGLDQPVRAEEGKFLPPGAAAPYLFAYQKGGVTCWVDTARTEAITGDDGQKVISVWVRCAVEPAAREDVVRTFYKDAKPPGGLDNLAYYEENYWFILADPGYPPEKLPVRVMLARLYYDASGSGKTIDFESILFRGWGWLRQYYAVLAADDKMILGLCGYRD